MKIWTDKEGNKLNYKDFINRWKSGIEGITPLQQVKMQVKSTWLMVVGLLCGIVMSIIGIRTLWWLLIILVAGLFNTLVQLIGVWQKKRALENIQTLMKGGGLE